MDKITAPPSSTASNHYHIDKTQICQPLHQALQADALHGPDSMSDAVASWDENKAWHPMHGLCQPTAVRNGERLKAFVSPAATDGDSLRVLASVWRLSPLGGEICFRGQVPQWATSRIDLELQVGNQTVKMQNLKPAGLDEAPGRPRLLYVPWDQKALGSEAVRNDRAHSRWTCPDDVTPVVFVENPVRLGDTMYLLARDISAAGMGLVTSLRNKHLIPGMRMRCEVWLPGEGYFKTEIQLAYCRHAALSEGAKLAAGVAFLGLERHQARMLGRWALRFCRGTSGPTPRQLKDAKLWSKYMAKCFDFGYVENAADYQAVLKLRHEAYAGAHKIQSDISPQSMGDKFDRISRILVAWHRGEAVASLRIAFAESDKQLEQEQFIALPQDYPRELVVEMGRACTRKDYRGGDLLLGLFRLAALVCLQAQRRYIITGATEDLLPLYLRLGFRKMHLTYTHPSLGAKLHHVIVLDMLRSSQGVANPLKYVAYYTDVLDRVDNLTLQGSESFLEARRRLLRKLKPLWDNLREHL